jgi:NADH-quinone oxidoreductase subunit G
MTQAPDKTEQAAKTDLVTLTIDGITVSVPKGTLVIRAAEQIGVQIPRFCDHPLLEPVGACRQCLVEVATPGPDGSMRTMQGPPGRMKPQASCTLVASEGMEVKTQLTSPGADKAQQGVMEALLINHPLDCPVCDKGGECPLQNQAMTNGRGESRFSANGGVKRTYPKPINISAQVLLDRERCVLCARCTRFSEQVAGDPFIALIERGALQQVGIYENQPFESYFSGNTIQICPVGALTSADYRFRSRPFDLVSVPSVAEHDACGSAIRVDHRRGKVMRRLAGNDPDVNEEWITDKDRFAFHYLTAPDRITYPQVRDEDGSLRPASWTEAFAVASRGLAAAGGTGVLTGGRLTLEDAYAYAKFARVALGTNDIDFRARPHTGEEADFLARHVALSEDVTYADLERATVVLLAGLEPEDEAGTIFLRLRKASRKHGTRVVSVAPFETNGLRKMGGRLVPTVPGAEAEALRAQADDGLTALDGGGLILVGERLATSPGALAAAVELARTTGARLAWVPRRAGDRGAVEAGCLPGLLPLGRPVADAQARVDLAAAWGVDTLPGMPGRDAAGIVAALASKDLGGLVVAGVDPDDTADPAATRAALEAASFVVSLELRETDVTRAADVVLPVAPTTDKAGTFVTWEGRRRPFDAALSNPGSLPDLRVLAGIAEELAATGHGAALGFRTVPEVRRELDQLGAWDGGRPEATALPTGGRGGEGGHVLASWKPMLDLGSMQDGEAHLRATARTPVARVSPGTYEALGSPARVTVTGDRGGLTLPVEPTPMPDDVVWVPQKSVGAGVLAGLAAPGSRVSVKGADQ